MGRSPLGSMGKILAARHCSKKQFQPFKISSALENSSPRPLGSLVSQINSLQGHQKRDAVIHVLSPFLLSVNLRTKLLIGPELVKPV